MLSKLASFRIPLARRSMSAVRTMSTAPRVNESTCPTYTPSLFDMLFLGSSMPRVPLTEAFPHLPALQDPDVPSDRQVTVSTLPSGLRVATVKSASPVTALGVFVDAGSRYEYREISGITQFLETMSLKSTTNRTDFRLVRETLKMGASILTSSSREGFVYSSECLPEHVPAIVGTLSDLIYNNLFHVEELIEERQYAEKDATARTQLVDLQLMEAIHEAAYGAQTVGLPLYAPVRNLEHFSAELLRSYQQTFFTADRMVISAIGVDHSQFVALVAEAFDQAKPAASGSIEKLPAVYTGGDLRLHQRGDAGMVNVALAFEGASWHDADLVPMCVLQMMMGGGGSFSAGGPGKGMYSRLFNNVLNKFDWAVNANSFMSIYTDTALFGLSGASSYEHAGQMMDVLAKEAVRMAGAVDETELKRAKNQLKSAVLMQLENRSVLLEDIGRQIITYGQVKSPVEVCALVDAVTAADVRRVAARMLKSPISVAAHGDLLHVPRYDIIQKLIS